jgi:predicted anti-sigma-YlaC factor YlaD
MRCARAWELYAAIGALDWETQAHRDALAVYIDHLHSCPVCRDHNQRLFSWARHVCQGISEEDGHEDHCLVPGNPD